MGRFSHDGYARLPYDPARAILPEPYGGAVTFFDVNPGARWVDVLNWFESVPPAVLARSPVLLLRWSEDLTVDTDATVRAGLAQVARQLGERLLRPRIGAARFSVGVAPRIVWHDRPPDVDDSRFLQRARAAELAAFLEWGNAISRPSTYHYVLPSGHHARTFVRIAEALRGDPRAAAAISTWMYHGLALDKSTTIVVDTGTLSPVITELQAAAGRTKGVRTPRVLALDSYPVSQFEFRQLVKPAQGSWVLGLLSVSSSGGLHSQFRSVLKDTVGDNYRLETLVERRPDHRAAVHVPDSAHVDGSQAAWIGLGDHLDSPVQPYGEAGCGECRDATRARLVRIDPRSLSPMALPAPVRVVPDISDGRRNRTLWERYDIRMQRDDDSPRPISFRGPTGTRRYSVRLREESRQVFFEPAFLLGSDGAEQLVTDRLAALERLPRTDTRDHGPEDVRRVLMATRDTEADVVVMDAEERRLFADAEWAHAWPAIVRAAGGGDALLVLHDPAAPRGLELTAVGGAALPPAVSRVAIVALGVRSGVTLQRTFLNVRETWVDATIAGVAVHAHPSDSQYWASMRNTFTDETGFPRLVALWLTYLPRRSPLAEELRLLNSLTIAEYPADLRDLVTARTGGDARQPFWGRADLELRPTSYFGEGLHGDTLLVAVGAAVHSRRLAARVQGTPDWAVFDLPRTFRSYFDGMIHAAVVRWLEPAECWWGDHPDESVDLLEELEHRTFQTADWQLLLPELLLAGAQSKLPALAIDHVVDRADAQLRARNNSWPADVLHWVKLGRWLCERATEGR